MGVHLQKAESHGALVLEEPVSRTCNDPPPTKPILSYRFLQRLDRHTFGSKQLYLWLKSFQRKEKMTTLNRLLLKKAHRRLCSHVKQNQKDTCKISCWTFVFSGGSGEVDPKVRLWDPWVSWSPQAPVLMSVTQYQLLLGIVRGGTASSPWKVLSASPGTKWGNRGWLFCDGK